MASNYTENYQLPLWAADDAFLRTEFNDANQKIDAAIREAERIRLLAECTAEEEQTTLSLDVSEIDLTQFRHIELQVNTIKEQTTGSSGTSMPLYLRVNGQNQSYWGHSALADEHEMSTQNSLVYFYQLPNADTFTPPMLWFTPPSTHGRVGCVAVYFNRSGTDMRVGVGVNISDALWPEVNTFDLMADYSVILPGTQMRLFGVV